MNLGDLLLRSALLFAVSAAILFLLELRGRRNMAADWLYGLHAAAVIAAMSLLCSHFLGHRFEYRYVWEYSSRALPPALSLAASWAGQEGSILLWVGFGALTGLALLRQPGSLARPAVLFVALAQAGLLSLLLVRSPFQVTSITPADGQGLNPLLQDPWMVIHPPVLFAGYAAMVVPFSLAAAALALGRWREWSRAVWPWTLMAVVTLGIGIALGGVWAYKVLGWGGYWGWDPVENASLVPWLLAVALLHGLFIQKVTGGLVRGNALIALLGWLSVLGGTYLTRSGVLQDFSVHSFADSGLNAPLVLNLLGTLVLALALLVWGWRRIETRPPRWAGVSRESALWVGLVTVLVFAAMVSFGTLAPLLTAMAGRPASVRATFYQSMSVPLGGLLVVVMAVAPALRWSRQLGLGWVMALVPGFAGAVAAFAGALLLGARDPSHLALIAIAGLALAINLQMTVRLFRRGWFYGAGYLGHAGLAVMVLGMVMSTALGRSERVTLRTGETRSALGYSLTYRGDHADEQGGRQLDILVTAGDWRFEARPQLLEMPGREGSMHKPAMSARREIYLSPLEVRAAGPATGGVVWLPQGRPVAAGGAVWTFAGFRMETHGSMRVFADIDVRRGAETLRISPSMQSDRAGTRPVPTEVTGIGPVSLARIDADGRRVGVLMPGGPPQRLAVLEFSTKPLINLVWVGALLTLLGTALAGVRRAMEVSGPRAAGRSVAARVATDADSAG
jgi:cytochrome c-type biogenesis protein CcmF